MIREIVKPTSEFIQIQIPKEYINQEIEILVFNTIDYYEKPGVYDTKKIVQEFREVSKNISKIDPNIDIVKLDEDINSDIF